MNIRVAGLWQSAYQSATWRGPARVQGFCAGAIPRMRQIVRFSKKLRDVILLAMI